MIYWVLILVMGASGPIKITGYQSRGACEEAGRLAVSEGLATIENPQKLDPQTLALGEMYHGPIEAYCVRGPEEAE